MNNRGCAWSKGEETGISPGRVYIVKEIFTSQKGTSQNGYWGSRQRTRLPLVMNMGKQELSDGWQVKMDGGL